jgi:hypothetical protein
MLVFELTRFQVEIIFQMPLIFLLTLCDLAIQGKLRRADMQSYEAVHSSTWRRTTFLKSALH